MPVSATRFDIVIPTLRRPSLSQLLLALDLGRGPSPERVVVVDDRASGAAQPLPDFRRKLRGRVSVLRSGGRGHAAARNLGWRASSAPWIAFVDDDVLLPEDWLARLHADLAALGEKVAGSQGRIPSDVAYRRSALETLSGFDERFLLARREDSDLAARAQSAGYELRRGRRRGTRSMRSARARERAAALAHRVRGYLIARAEGRCEAAWSGGA
jgi:GT2 family glycosyltransferase